MQLTSLFGGVDPLASSMPSYSPYAYVFNNPISFTDPTGMVGECLACGGVGNAYSSSSSNEGFQGMKDEFQAEVAEVKRKRAEETRSRSRAQDNEPTPQELSDQFGESYQSVAQEIRDLVWNGKSTEDIVYSFYNYVVDLDSERRILPKNGSYPWALQTVGAKMNFYEADPGFGVIKGRYSRQTYEGTLWGFNGWDSVQDGWYGQRGYISNPGVYRPWEDQSSFNSGSLDVNTHPIVSLRRDLSVSQSYIVFRVTPLF